MHLECVLLEYMVYYVPVYSQISLHTPGSKFCMLNFDFFQMCFAYRGKFEPALTIVYLIPSGGRWERHSRQFVLPTPLIDDYRYV